MFSSSRLLRSFSSLKHLQRATRPTQIARIGRPEGITRASSSFVATSSRLFHASTAQYVALMPDSENPPPREAEEHDQSSTAALLEPEEYNRLADTYLNKLVSKLEEKAEESDGLLDFDFDSGVLMITTKDKGSIVINKQPPNKQIWFAAPSAGPMRFDWVVSGESMHEKEGAGIGSWTYLRDGRTLDQVLQEEIGIDMVVEPPI